MEQMGEKMKWHGLNFVLLVAALREASGRELLFCRCGTFIGRSTLHQIWAATF